jgi:hypothetical protein
MSSPRLRRADRFAQQACEWSAVVSADNLRTLRTFILPSASQHILKCHNRNSSGT